MNVITDEISLKEWKRKLHTFDIDWVILQYNGLKELEIALGEEVDVKTELLKQTHELDDFNDMYKDYIYPIEDRLMEIDTQLVDVEDELEKRNEEMRC